MIILRDLTKVYSLHGRQNVVADGINAVFPSRTSVALMGRNGAGKSTLLRMIAGTSDPTSGDILSDGTISYPVGFAGSFHPDLTGAQNTLFVARIYGADTDKLTAYVEDFAELGSHFHLPVRSYSSGMRSRLAFGVSMGLQFDTYLIDEITAVGDADFKRKSRTVFKERMKQAGSIFVSHSVRMMREMCDAGAVLENGRLTYYDDIEEALDRHMFDMHGSGSSLSVIGDEYSAGRADQLLPAGARLLYGLGVPHAGLEWLSRILRKSRKCLCQPQKEIHYFDILAGKHTEILERRVKTLHRLSEALNPDANESEKNFKTLQQMNAVSALLSIHAGSPESENRHQGYVDYLLTGRKNQPVLCDFTPSYCMLGTDEFRDMAGIGDCLFLLVFRDPASRIWAEICAQHAGKGLPEEDYRKVCLKDLRRAIKDPALTRHPSADYAGMIRRLEGAVARERILYLFYETLFTQSSINRLCRFINLPEHPLEPVPTDGEAFEMPAPLAKELRDALSPQYEAMKAKFKDNLPAGWQGAPLALKQSDLASDDPELAR